MREITHKKAIPVPQHRFFITFDTSNNPKQITTTPRCARGKEFFDMRFIFTPIHHCLHFTCAVIHMEQKKIEYCNSLHFENKQRQSYRHKIKMQEDTLQILRDYLQNEQMQDKNKDFNNEWKLHTMCKVPQQDTTNTTDCGLFVCMYCNFILNDCKLDFRQNDITNSDWRESCQSCWLNQQMTKRWTTMTKLHFAP